MNATVKDRKVSLTSYFDKKKSRMIFYGVIPNFFKKLVWKLVCEAQ